jgi:hypothetical protein
MLASIEHEYHNTKFSSLVLGCQIIILVFKIYNCNNKKIYEISTTGPEEYTWIHNRPKPEPGSLVREPNPTSFKSFFTSSLQGPVLKVK